MTNILYIDTVRQRLQAHSARRGCKTCRRANVRASRARRAA